MSSAAFLSNFSLSHRCLAASRMPYFLHAVWPTWICPLAGGHNASQGENMWGGFGSEMRCGEDGCAPYFHWSTQYKRISFALNTEKQIRAT
jgi:hypothetical protein